MPVDEIEQDCRVEAILKPDDTITLDLVQTFSLAPRPSSQGGAALTLGCCVASFQDAFFPRRG